MARPLAIDLFCGLGGWTEGLLAEGYDVVGFDIERHEYGPDRYPAQLVIQDVRTLAGAQFRGADLIVASPPCQEPSYRAMPWSRAKALNDAGPPYRFLELFQSCFRIQHEAIAKRGRHIPLVIENVRGAQRWVGRARWNCGSFYLWGDVPALMPISRYQKAKGEDWNRFRETGEVSPHWVKQAGLSGPRANGKGDRWFQDGAAAFGSRSIERREASAKIARIPFELARHIGRVFAKKETAGLAPGRCHSSFP